MYPVSHRKWALLATEAAIASVAVEGISTPKGEHQKGELMLKKLFITAAAAAAMSVPLAGVAWADPPSGNNPPGQNPTGPGVPHGVGATLDAITAIGQATNPALPDLNPNGTGNPVPPGQAFNQAKDQYPDAKNTPTAVADFVNKEFNDYLGINTAFTIVPPGLATKTFTPGCKSGHTATDPNGNAGQGSATEKRGSCTPASHSRGAGGPLCAHRSDHRRD